MKNGLKSSPPTAEKSVIGYMKERTVKARGKNIPMASLYYSYRQWARLKASTTISAKKFYLILEQNGYSPRSSQHGKVFRNISFIN